ncbi:MAG: arsenosugar biosynthesis radical SAM (seleno)protein ArsS [Syntrophomonadaceae bacterium]
MRSLHARALPLASEERQRALVDSVDLSAARSAGDFARALSESGWPRLPLGSVEIFQINLGKLCNMTCRHCHVDAGPDRTAEVMSRETVDACLAALDRSGAHTVDLTGGAPELNPSFRYVVDQVVSRGKNVIDRCNLTVLLLPTHEDLPGWLAERGVEVVASLPHWRRRGTDAQRGDGTFERSLEALRRLNAAGYGRDDPRRRLTLVANPVGAFLPANQSGMEREWKAGLAREHGVTFDRLIVLNNMPIARFLEWLEESGNLASYMELLVNSFNPATVAGLMCRNTLSISWDGRVYDCDFNQMLDLPARSDDGSSFHVRDLSPERLAERAIVTGRHCFGCTAGAGSSCGGAISG